VFRVRGQSKILSSSNRFAGFVVFFLVLSIATLITTRLIIKLNGSVQCAALTRRPDLWIMQQYRGPRYSSNAVTSAEEIFRFVVTVLIVFPASDQPTCRCLVSLGPRRPNALTRGRFAKLFRRVNTSVVDILLITPEEVCMV
jgi:hypothetical protein